MKKMLPTLLASMLAALAGAQTIKLDTQEQWNVPFKDGTVEIKGRMKKALSKEMLKLDPTARYTLKWTVRKGDPGQKGRYMIGFSVYDEQKREIQPYHVYFTPGSETVLAEAARKGAKTIRVKDGAKWKSGAMYCPAFFARKDHSDIPNRDVLIGGIEKVTPGNGWTELTLKRPLEKDYPAGTALRQHLYMSSFYLKTGETPGEWKQESASVSGRSEGGTKNGKWWPGTAYFRIMTIGNIASDSAESRTVLKDVILEIKGSDSIF